MGNLLNSCMKRNRRSENGVDGDDEHMEGTGKGKGREERGGEGESPEKRIKQDILNSACFGAGCYWGTENFIKNKFGVKVRPGSIIGGKVGFMGPSGCKSNPSYKEVCSGTTGHVEVYDFEFSGGAEMYRELVR